MRYSNIEVTDIFVNRRGTSAVKSYSEHLHCKEGILFSYRTPIAIWSYKLRQHYTNLLGNSVEITNLPGNLIFLTEERYSITTAIHEGYLRYAGNGQIYEIPTEIEILTRSPAEFMQRLKEKVRLCKDKQSRARKEQMREYWQELSTKYARLVEMFTPISFLEKMKFPINVT